MDNRQIRMDDPEFAAAPVSPERSRDEVMRLLRDRGFAASDRRRQMLRYIAEEALAGREKSISGFSIATEVFGRTEDFDAQNDSIVRIEARRLRRDLDSYYMGAGRRAAVRISIPKGRYVPVFERYNSEPPQLDKPSVPEPAPPPEEVVRRRWLPWAYVALSLGVILVAGALWRGIGPVEPPASPVSASAVPGVLVQQFAPLRDTDSDRLLASGIWNQVVNDLMRFPDFRVFAPSAEQASLTEDANQTERLREQGVAFVLRATLATGTTSVRVNAQLLDTLNGEVIWSEQYDRALTVNDLFDVQNDIAASIASAVGQPYGIVRNHLSNDLDADLSPDLQGYECVLRAYQYRRNFADGDFDGAMSCLQETVVREPDYAEAWAMLGWMHLDEGRFGHVPDQEKNRVYTLAIDAASRGLLLDPQNIMAIKALSSINFYMGNYAEGERLARQALDMNPYDPDTLAQLGWRTAVRGNFADGIPLVERAIERTINPPGWYYHLPVIDRYMRGDLEGMLNLAERSSIDGSGISLALLAIAQAELGQMEDAHDTLRRMEIASPAMKADPLKVFRNHQATDEIVAKLKSGLEKAGWRPS